MFEFEKWEEILLIIEMPSSLPSSQILPFSATVILHPLFSLIFCKLLPYAPMNNFVEFEPMNSTTPVEIFLNPIPFIVQTTPC